MTEPPSQPGLPVAQDDRAVVMIDAVEAEADGDAMQYDAAPPFALEIEPLASMRIRRDACAKEV